MEKKGILSFLEAGALTLHALVQTQRDTRSGEIFFYLN